MNENGEHVFVEDLRFSSICHLLPMWSEAYSKAFPGCGTMLHEMDGEHQRAGIDRSITLPNSKQVLVDEKARRPNKDGSPWRYSDVLLEYVSNDRTWSPGWVAKSLRADYVAYGIVQTGRVLLLPVIAMQAAWLRHGDQWLRAYGKKEAPNRGYRTLNCPVPETVLFAAIGGWHRLQCAAMSWEQLDLFARSQAVAA